MLSDNVEVLERRHVHVEVTRPAHRAVPGGAEGVGRRRSEGANPVVDAGVRQGCAEGSVPNQFAWVRPTIFIFLYWLARSLPKLLELLLTFDVIVSGKPE